MAANTSMGHLLAAVWRGLQSVTSGDDPYSRRAHGGGGSMLGSLCSCPCLIVAHSLSSMNMDERVRAPVSGVAAGDTVSLLGNELSRMRNNSMGEDDTAELRPSRWMINAQTRAGSEVPSEAISRKTGPEERAVEASALLTEIDAAEDPFGEAGQCCSICSSETRRSTHFAVPCRHAACERCWKLWLKEQSTCMMCCSHVACYRRFAYSLVPAQPHELQMQSSAFHLINNDLETSIAGLAACFVTIKSLLSDVSEQLAEMDSHLGGSIWHMHPDARKAVASVEMSAFGEHLAAIARIFAEAGAEQDESAPFVALHAHMRALEAVLARLGRALDEAHDAPTCDKSDEREQRCVRSRGAGEEEGGDGEVRAARRRADEEGIGTSKVLLRDCSWGVISAQWNAAVGMSGRVLSKTVPEVLSKLQRHGVVRDDMGCASAVRQVQESAEREVRRTTEAMDALLPELELMVIRVESCFDYDG
jgi:hypothetical protein